MRLLVILVVALLCSFVPRTSFAQVCSVTAPAVYFGNVGVPIPHTDVSTNVNVSCSGFSPGTLRVCIGITPASFLGFVPRTMANGWSGVGYEIYTASNHTGVWDDSTRLAVPVTIGSAGTGTATVTMYAHMPAGGSPAAGMYESVGDDKFVGDIRSGNNCNSTQVGTFSGGSFNVSSFMRGSCTISTLSQMNFGTTQGGTNPQIDAEARLRANCNDELPYTIALNKGEIAGNTVAARKLGLNGTGPGVIRYDLYQNAGRTTFWGEGGGSPVYSATGSGQNQDITVYGRIPAGQAMPAGGIYRDTVTATITY